MRLEIQKRDFSLDGQRYEETYFRVTYIPFSLVRVDSTRLGETSLFGLSNSC